MIFKLFSRISPQRGFSLIELMITIAIVMLVTGMALMRYSGFNNAVLLKSQAYELALDIRQAQVYGISVSGQTKNFNAAYGIAFDLTSTATAGKYQLFQDKNDNQRFNPGLTGANREEVGSSTYAIDPRFFISQICSNGSNCVTPPASVNPTSAVSFKRPNFDARIYKSGLGSPVDLQITIASVSNPSNTRTVTVYASGQIAVQ